MSLFRAGWPAKSTEKPEAHLEEVSPAPGLSRALARWRSTARLALVGLVILLLLGRSSLPPGDQTERVRAFTRAIEFDFVTWTLDALSLKGSQSALGATAYLPPESQSQLVLDYLARVEMLQQTERQLNQIYADPEVADPDQASAALRQTLAAEEAELASLQPIAEAALQDQLGEIIAEMGLSLSGQSVPPVLYHTSSTPLALVVSPRDAIRQDENISIDPSLTVDQQAELEDQVDQALNLSSLVVPIGGIGLYPTMVMETSDINWLAEVVAHEWIHNYLSLRPLGIYYLDSPALRTMNETVASIAGKELGLALVARYFPDHLPPPPAPPAAAQPATPPDEPPPFDFRAEMALTRQKVDELLADGQFEAAEAYMEARRQVFWENGYRLRKINQAYFAFYGAYADQPGGASAGDPVGDAVRALRSQTASLAGFVKQAAWLTSFDQLQGLIESVE